MKIVYIQFCMTIETSNALPIRIERLVPILLGRSLDGKPIRQTLFGHEITDEGALEVDLVLPSTFSFESLSPLGSLSLTRLSGDGTLRTSDIDLRPQPMSAAYKQLTLLAEDCK